MIVVLFVVARDDLGVHGLAEATEDGAVPHRVGQRERSRVGLEHVPAGAHRRDTAARLVDEDLAGETQRLGEEVGGERKHHAGERREAEPGPDANEKWLRSRGGLRKGDELAHPTFCVPR